jgi:cytochrome c-type biogenesis protein
VSVRPDLRPGRGGRHTGFFLFGLAYGASSLGCALTAFLAVVGSGITAGGAATDALRF